MFKVIKENKIIAISDTDSEFVCLIDEVVEDTEHTTDDYDQYNGEYLLKSEIPAPSNEYQSKQREMAYIAEVDPITAHIQRLRDDDPESEEIAKLIAERTAKREEIKARYPYNE